MITVDKTTAEITTRRVDPNTKEVSEGKMKLRGVRITVETPYGTSYRWTRYVSRGKYCQWKREGCRSARKSTGYSDVEVLDNLIAQSDPRNGVDAMIAADKILAAI